jgi:hypothetical protein
MFPRLATLTHTSSMVLDCSDPSAHVPSALIASHFSSMSSTTLTVSNLASPSFTATASTYLCHYLSTSFVPAAPFMYNHLDIANLTMTRSTTAISSMASSTMTASPSLSATYIGIGLREGCVGSSASTFKFFSSLTVCGAPNLIVGGMVLQYLTTRELVRITLPCTGLTTKWTLSLSLYIYIYRERERGRERHTHRPRVSIQIIQFHTTLFSYN